MNPSKTLDTSGKAKARLQTLHAAREYKPYPRYKDSGVEWLGRIPVGWRVQRLRVLAGLHVSNVDKHVKQDEMPVRLCNYVDVYYQDYITEYMNLMHATATLTEIEKFRLRKGDVIITKDSESWDDIGVPTLVKSANKDMVCGYHLALLRPHQSQVTGNYLFRVMQASATAYQFQIAAKGVTRYGLSHNGIKLAVLPCPPINEQKAITHLLDRETAKINALIEKKEQLIELLKERRTALITRAVTKGLNPNAPMKDSGVEWLGEIPKHWGTRRLKALCTQSALYGANIPASRYVNAGVRFIRTTDIDDGRLKEGGVFVTNADASNYVLTDGDLLISRSGTVGRSFLYNSESHGPCAYAGYLVRFVFSNAMLPKYAFLFTKTISFSGFLKTTAISSTIENLNGEKFSNAMFPNPPVAEQVSIIKFLDYETEKIDALIAKTHEAIDKLKEFRTALISSAVTGKINVLDDAA